MGFVLEVLLFKKKRSPTDGDVDSGRKATMQRYSVVPSVVAFCTLVSETFLKLRNCFNGIALKTRHN